MVTYWIVHAFFFICDKYEYLQKYKLKREKHQIPSNELIYKTIKASIIGQSLEPFIWYFGLVPFYFHLNPSMNDEILVIYLKFMLCDVLYSFLFYVGHRAMHSKYLYKYHKQHHEYNGPISIATEYNHWIDLLLTSITIFVVPPIICCVHPLQFTIWLIWMWQLSYETHSGYVFHGSFAHKIGLTHSVTASCHDFHHSHNNGSFGNIQWDILFDTVDKEWNKWYQNLMKLQ